MEKGCGVQTESLYNALKYSKEVPNPRYVRYGWQPFTRANLINREGLPASTFRAEFSMK